MSDTSTTKKWDGLPPNPSRSGLHYISDAVALWEAGRQQWSLLGKTRRVTPEWLAAQSWAEYRFPCPWPDDHAKAIQKIDEMQMTLNELQLTVDAVLSGEMVVIHCAAAGHA